jgi:hypothetical protein
MIEDHTYKTSSERLLEPPLRHDEQKAILKLKYQKERPIIQKLLEHLNGRIAYFESMNSIATLDDPEQFMREVALSKAVATVLKKEAGALERLVKMFDKK